MFSIVLLTQHYVSNVQNLPVQVVAGILHWLSVLHPLSAEKLQPCYK